MAVNNRGPGILESEVNGPFLCIVLFVVNDEKHGLSVHNTGIFCASEVCNICYKATKRYKIEADRVLYGDLMLKIGTIYRMPRPQQKDVPTVDGLPNFYYESNTPNVGFEFQRGIHNVQTISLNNGGKRSPLIIISSTPRKAGSEDTPWHDRYDADHGFVKYYGDNKYFDNPRRPEDAPGNKVLLDLLKHYHSEDLDDRLENAVPIIFFEKCTYEGRPKGNAIFHGFGVLESAELVTQYDRHHRYFANYMFTFCIFSLAGDNEQFSWQWIKDRCNPALTNFETMKHAPASWKQWVGKGKDCLHLVRRSVSGRGLVIERQQIPSDMSMLNRIYGFYGGRTSNKDKHDFEYLAMEATVKTIEESGAKCVPGWITKTSGDGGVDFVLRIDIGHDELASVRIIVLGQAKCTDPSKPVNGKDIARTVARMKRGWIGAFVTTSYFSEPVQQEVKEDSYPLLMINGAKLADIVDRVLFENKQTLDEYLESLKSKYKVMIRIPEDILDI